MRDPTSNKCNDDCLSGYVDYFRPASKMVNTIRSGKGRQRCTCVSLNLGFLALVARVGISLNM